MGSRISIGMAGTPLEHVSERAGAIAQRRRAPVVLSKGPRQWPPVRIPNDASAQAPESNVSAQTRKFIRTSDESVQAILQRELHQLSTAEVEKLQGSFAALGPRQRYLIQDILKVGAQVEKVTSQFQRLGWNRIRNAPLLVLLALNPARKNEGSTAVALAWYFGTNMIRIQTMIRNLTSPDSVPGSLQAVADLNRIDTNVKAYLGSHFPELLAELDDLTKAAKARAASSVADLVAAAKSSARPGVKAETEKASIFSGNPFLASSGSENEQSASEEESDQTSDLEA